MSLWRLAAMRRLAAVATLGFSSFFLTLAAVPSYAVRSGVSSAAAGVVTAGLLAGTVITQLFVPALERRLGTPRLLAIGLVALGLPAPLYLLSSHLGWLVTVSVIRGLGFAVVTVLGALLSTREAPPGRHGEAIGIYGLSIAAPNLLAVPAGTALTSYGHFGWVAVLAACPLLALPLARQFRPAGTADAALAHGRPAAAVRAAAVPSLILLVVTLSCGGLVTFLPIARPHGILASIALLAYGTTAAVSRWRAGAIADRTGVRLLLPAALVLAAGGLALVAMALLASGEAVLLFVGAGVFGVGYGAIQNLTQVVAFARAGPANTATASATWNAAFDCGTAIGAYGVGLVAATALELSGTYFLCAALMLLATPAAVGAAARHSTPAAPPPPH